MWEKRVLNKTVSRWKNLVMREKAREEDKLKERQRDHEISKERTERKLIEEESRKHEESLKESLSKKNMELKESMEEIQKIEETLRGASAKIVTKDTRLAESEKRVTELQQQLADAEKMKAQTIVNLQNSESQ